MSKFLFVNSGTENKHNSNDENCGGEDKQIVVGRGSWVVNTKLKVSPPMETLEDVEEDQHTNNFNPIAWSVLVN